MILCACGHPRSSHHVTRSGNLTWCSRWEPNECGCRKFIETPAVTNPTGEGGTVTAGHTRVSEREIEPAFGDNGGAATAARPRRCANTPEAANPPVADTDRRADVESIHQASDSPPDPRRGAVNLALAILDQRSFCPCCRPHVAQASAALRGASLDELLAVEVVRHV